MQRFPGKNPLRKKKAAVKSASRSGMRKWPTTTSPQESVAVHLQFVLPYASNLYCLAFGATEFSGKGNTWVLLRFVSQYASHLYRSTPPICIAILLGKSWWLWSPGCSPTTASGNRSHERRQMAITGNNFLMCSRPALNLSKNFCVFPVSNMALGRQQYEKSWRMGTKTPMATNSD